MYISPDIELLNISERKGNAGDLHPFVESHWLLSSEVRYLLQYQKSRWHLTMIYISLQNPLHLICRKIDSYADEQKALTYAGILQRAIRKDARGTLKLNTDAIHFCNN